MSWGTCYSGSNNIHKDFPALMSDGKQFTLYNPACDLNEKLKKKTGMKNNYEYRQFLISNGVSLINKNNISSCDECSECIDKFTEMKSYGKYLYKSINDKKQHYGYESSDLKNLYLERRELQNSYVSPIVTQEELLKLASKR
tara:strand:- start:95 stop:520 length:426 start_codon:yes stop_codon:yes gene_type:complete